MTRPTSSLKGLGRETRKTTIKESISDCITVMVDELLHHYYFRQKGPLLCDVDLQVVSISFRRG